MCRGQGFTYCRCTAGTQDLKHSPDDGAAHGRHGDVRFVQIGLQLAVCVKFLWCSAARAGQNPSCTCNYDQVGEWQRSGGSDQQEVRQVRGARKAHSGDQTSIRQHATKSGQRAAAVEKSKLQPRHASAGKPHQRRRAGWRHHMPSRHADNQAKPAPAGALPPCTGNHAPTRGHKKHPQSIQTPPHLHRTPIQASTIIPPPSPSSAANQQVSISPTPTRTSSPSHPPTSATTAAAPPNAPAQNSNARAQPSRPAPAPSMRTPIW